jgi:23S rRNA pseudouridine1911/1915/1917 synthase
LLDVLYEDNHLLVINKPPAIATMGVAPGRPSVLVEAKRWIAQKHNKPGNVYLGVVSRLDAPVTGVLLMARTSKAAARLTAALRAREMTKIYHAVCPTGDYPPEATLEHYLRKDERHRKVHVTHAKAPGAQVARLSYRTLGSDGKLNLLEVQLETGRKHQIRVQLAKAVTPIVGDRKYGSDRELSVGIALHARRLELAHPVGSRPMQFEAPLPASWYQDRGIQRLLEQIERRSDG